MISNVNVSEINNNTQGLITKFNSKIGKAPKTPENFYSSNTNNRKHHKKNAITFQRRKISTNNLEPNLYFQPLTLSKEENKNNLCNILYKKFLITISKYEQVISELSIINKKFDNNNEKVEELKHKLKKLKENKKQKQSDIVNLLSNKESLEEIYKNKLYYLIENKDIKNKKIKKIEYSNDDLGMKGDLKGDENKMVHIPTDSEIYKIDGEDELDIKIEEIKISDKKKYIEQIINFTEDIFQKNEEEFKNQIKEKINLAYKVFTTEINSSSLINTDSIISNFFSRIGLYISNHSLGNYSEININKFLRYLLKINSIGIEIIQIIKFLNKKYKEKKIEIKEQINYLIKKNENLNEKKKNLEQKREALEIKIEKKKENLKNFEQNKYKLIENEKQKHLNITSDGLYSISNIINSRKYKIINEGNNETNNNENENIYYNLKQINNSKERKYRKKLKIEKENYNINEKKDIKFKYLSNNDTKKNVLKIKKNNSNNNIIEINNKSEKENQLISKEKNEPHKGNKEKEFQENELQKKIKIGLDKIKANKISMNKIFKIKNKKINDINNITEINTYKNKNIQNNFNKINSVPNNINDINNNRINVNNLVINNEIKIKNINDIIKPVQENNNQIPIQEKSDINKHNNNRMYYSKKKVENVIIKKIKPNDSNNNVFKNIIVNNKEQIKDKDDININSSIKETNMYNRNSFNYTKKPQINKNIYIINNINNSEQYNAKNNIYKNTYFRNINIDPKIEQKTEIINEDYNGYINKTFDKNKLDKKKENINVINNDTKNENGNHSYNFHDILNVNKKDSLTNKLLKNINLENIKLIPIKKLDNLKVKNIQNSPTLLQGNKKNKEIFPKNNFNTNEENNISKAKKKLTDTHIINNNNYNLAINMNLMPNNNNKVKMNNNQTNKVLKISKIPISSYFEKRILKSNNNEKVNKTDLSLKIKRAGNLSP